MVKSAGGSFENSGRDAFHRVPNFSGRVWDDVEIVPTDLVGARSNSSRPVPLANLFARKPSLLVFSSKRRTRYAMPGNSSPTGQYSRTRQSICSSADLIGSAIP